MKFRCRAPVALRAMGLQPKLAESMQADQVMVEKFFVFLRFHASIFEPFPFAHASSAHCKSSNCKRTMQYIACCGHWKCRIPE